MVSSALLPTPTVPLSTAERLLYDQAFALLGMLQRRPRLMPAKNTKPEPYCCATGLKGTWRSAMVRFSPTKHRGCNANPIPTCICSKRVLRGAKSGTTPAGRVGCSIWLISHCLALFAKTVAWLVNLSPKSGSQPPTKRSNHRTGASI